MEIKNKKQTNKIGVYVVIIVALVLAGCAGVFAYKNLTNSNDSPTEEPSVTKEEEDNKKDTPEKESTDSVDETGEEKTESTETPDDDPTNGGKTPIQHEGENPQTSESLTGVINIFTKTEDSIVIRTTVNQYISDADARCDLVLTNNSNGATYNYWSDVVTAPQTSACYGWDIPLSDLGGNPTGSWTAKVTMTGGGRTGTFTSETNF